MPPSPVKKRRRLNSRSRMRMMKRRIQMARMMVKARKMSSRRRRRPTVKLTSPFFQWSMTPRSWSRVRRLRIK
jgi:hypothetical protein